MISFGGSGLSPQSCTPPLKMTMATVKESAKMRLQGAASAASTGRYIHRSCTVPDETNLVSPVEFVSPVMEYIREVIITHHVEVVANGNCSCAHNLAYAAEVVGDSRGMALALALVKKSRSYIAHNRMTNPRCITLSKVAKKAKILYLFQRWWRYTRVVVVKTMSTTAKFVEAIASNRWEHMPLNLMHTFIHTPTFIFKLDKFHLEYLIVYISKHFLISLTA
jgi:hypothetical protein